MEDFSLSIESIEHTIGYKFKNKELLKTAFTHSSFAHENRVESNERLEFLGDSALEYIVTYKLFSEFSLSEGNLSKFRQKLVSESPLAMIVEELGLDKYLLKGKGELKNKVDSKAIKADLFEAIVGAICIDSGIAQAKNFVLKALGSVFDSYRGVKRFDDPKTKIQETFIHEKIVYETKKLNKNGYFEYVSYLKINGVISGFGSGRNKKLAEEMAAQNALDKTTKE